MAKDFGSKQPAPQPDAPVSRAPKDQGGEPVTGFVQAPKSERDKGGPGPGIPASSRRIH
jgi:hypothetical protein